MATHLLGLFLALSCCLLARSIDVHEEALIGWRGETYSADEAKGVKKSWVQQVSWHPRAYVWHNMLTPEEAMHLRKLAAPQMRRSTVVGTNGSSVEDSYRTSYGTFVKRLSDPIVNAVSSRVAEWVKIPEVHQEDVQVLRYGVGQKYGAHMDSLIDESPRMATVLIYLADTEEGGETAFPEHSEWISEEARMAQGEMSSCVGSAVAVKPRLGSALLFFSTRPDGTHEPACTHAGCPVLSGHKWTATVWVHSQPFRPKTYEVPTDPPLPDPGLCEDRSPRCAEWASSGECEKNAQFMKGGGSVVGTCRAACKACTACTVGDDAWRKNRDEGGWLVYNTTTFI